MKIPAHNFDGANKPIKTIKDINLDTCACRKIQICQASLMKNYRQIHTFPANLRKN